MTIGIPRAMLYYRYKVLWETFFKELHCNIVISEETNKEILNNGIKYSIDECCLPSKIFMGHVYSLIGKCDYLFIPRVLGYGKDNDVCVKFNAFYDIVRNTFNNVKILDYNIDLSIGDSEKSGFIKIGSELGFGLLQTIRAYRKAKEAQSTYEKQKILKQAKALENNKLTKILIVAHPYITNDKLIGHPISDYIKKAGGIPVFADATNKRLSIKRSKEISNSLYWIYNRELIGAVKIFEDKIDGIILMTAFPCGPDSLVNELIIRKIKNVPVINIILDELQGEAGLQTRIESFMDIICERKVQ